MEADVMAFGIRNVFCFKKTCIRDCKRVSSSHCHFGKVLMKKSSNPSIPMSPSFLILFYNWRIFTPVQALCMIFFTWRIYTSADVQHIAFLFTLRNFTPMWVRNNKSILLLLFKWRIFTSLWLFVQVYWNYIFQLNIHLYASPL